MTRIHDTGYACEYRRKFWGARGYPIEWVEGEAREVMATKAADVVLVDPMWAGDFLEKSDRMSRELMLLKFADHLELRDGKYWPGAFTLAAFRKRVVSQARKLDLGDRAYVTGNSPWARLAIQVVFDLGYRQVKIIASDSYEAQKIVEEFSKFCFGLKIEIQDRNQLTLQPNNGSLLVNTDSLVQDPDLLAVLMYLNFIHRGGLIVDFEFVNDDGALCKEAHASGFKCITGLEIRGGFDFEILLQRGLVKDAELESYIADWQAFLKTEKPATSPVP